ncbi:hypothetical protein LWI29_017005 [Acer saccharum]|uniref:Reverse transcriptase domain-containing protein n=1 Tax=Acer saccharum TaxID=4024 RepID=A0AA39VBV5_ACESA|nr:hypothetical protein LWI29_017005 [Acer saccharum]
MKYLNLGKLDYTKTKRQKSEIILESSPWCRRSLRRPLPGSVAVVIVTRPKPEQRKRSQNRNKKGKHLSSQPKLVLNKSLNHGGAGHSSLNLAAIAEAKGVLPSNNGGLEDSNFVAPLKNVLGKMNGTTDQGNRSEKPNLGNPRNSTSSAILGNNGGLEDSNFVSPFKNVLGKINGTTDQGNRSKKPALSNPRISTFAAILGNNGGLEDSNSVSPFKNVLGKMNGTTNQCNGAHRPDQLHHVPFSSFGNVKKPASKGEACPSINIKGKKVQLEEVSSLRNSELPHNKADFMDRDVTNDEIRDVCFSLHPNKAPGPDGFNAHFFKKTWDIVGEDVINAIQKFFRSGHFLKEINATILALVPKVPNPSKMKDFRPISCCNTLYKIIAKIIANRIKPCLPDIINPSQSAFVAGRSTGDNILHV